MLSYWYIGIGVFCFFFLLFLYWFFKPYFAYKKSLKERHGRSWIVIEGKKQLHSSKPLLLEPQLQDKVYLSLVVPAYNEEERLPIMMEETLQFFGNKKKNNEIPSFEVVIVDDGSKDKTWELISKYSNDYQDSDLCKIRGIKLGKNSGKGAAVKKGMMFTTGDIILMLDADGATEITDYDKVETNIKHIDKDGEAISIGSRHVKEAVQRKCHRKLLMHISHFFIQTVCGVKVKDTQCGFKLFTRKSAARIFLTQHLERWAFDVELLFLATRFKIPIGEVSVTWREIEGSHLNVVSASIQMTRDFTLIRTLYMLGLWKYSDASF